MSPSVVLAAASSSGSVPGASLIPESTDLFTAAHLLWIALFAFLAILVIAWGVRQKAKRKAAEREVEERNAELLDNATAPPVPTPTAPTRRAELDGAPLAPPPAIATHGTVNGAAEGPVTQLKGLGPKVAGRLAELGVTTVGQMAALTDDEAAALDGQLGPFAGRMARDRWQEQARFLAAGDRAGFEAVFGKLN